MDIKDIKKAGVNNAEEIDIKEYELKDKNKKIKFEEIKIKKDKEEHKKGKFKKFWKKFWWIVWKDDSFRGWILSLIFIFIVIKLIFFPLLNLATGTSLPLAIVESCSMYHKADILGNFNSWWDRQDDKYSSYTINKLDFEKFKMKKGFNKGDILFIVKANPEKLEVGDVIIFNGNQRSPVIHRIIGINEDATTGKKTFSTMGDNNNGQLPFEKDISEEQLVGKAVVRIAPFIGWGKLVFFEGQKYPSERGFCTEN
jgi:signal peptidase I